MKVLVFYIKYIFVVDKKIKCFFVGISHTLLQWNNNFHIEFYFKHLLSLHNMELFKAKLLFTEDLKRFLINKTIIFYY